MLSRGALAILWVIVLVVSVLLTLNLFGEDSKTSSSGLGLIESTPEWQEPTYTPTSTPTPTLTPTPTSTPIPVVPTVSRNITTGVSGVPDWLESEIINSPWPTYLHSELISVMRKESGFDPNAISYTGCCFGLMQIHADTWAPYCGISGKMLFNPTVNLACAWKVYQYDPVPWGQWQAKP